MKTPRLLVLLLFCVAVLSGTALSQTVKHATVSDTWNKPGTWSPQGVPTVNDSVVIDAGVRVDINTNAVCRGLYINPTGIIQSLAKKSYTLNIYGGFTNHGTFDPVVNAQKFVDVYANGRGDTTFSIYTTPGSYFYSLYLSSTAHYKLATSDTIETVFSTPSGSYFEGGSYVLGIRNVWNNGGTTFVPGTGTIAYCKPGAQTVLPLQYYGLAVADTGTKTLSGPTTADGPLVLTSGTLAIGSHILTLNGAVSYGTGTLLGVSSSEIVMGGTSASTTLTVAGELKNLTIARSNGISLGGNILINSNLALIGGMLAINACTLTLNGSITYGTGMLRGSSSSNLVIGGTAPAPVLIVAGGLNNLTLARSAGASLGADLAVAGITTFTSGNIRLSGFNYTFGASATIAGTLDASHMIVTDGGGTVRRLFASTGSFTFPVGDETGTADYSPLAVEFLSGTFGSGAYAAVQCVPQKHPGNTDSTDFLNRYWEVTQNNITSYSCMITGTYVDGDVVGNESNINSALGVAGTWYYYASANSAMNQVKAVSTTTAGDLTGRHEQMGVIISNADGGWNTIATWNKGRLPLPSDSVVIRHYVSMNTSPTCKGLLIDGGKLVNAGTTQTLTVAGTLNSNNGTLAPGNFISVIMAGRTGRGTPQDTVYSIDGTSLTFYNLTITDTTALRSDLSVDNKLSVTSGDILWAKSAVITLKGAAPLSIQGDFRCETSTVVYGSDAAQTIAPLEYYNLVTQTPGVSTKTAGGRITIWGVLTVGPGTTYAAGANTLVLAGVSDPTPMVVYGTFDYGTSTVRYAGAGNQNVVPIDYYNLFVSRPDGSSTVRERHAAGSFSVYNDMTTDSSTAFNIYGQTISIRRNLTAVGPGSVPSANAGRNVWRSGSTLRFFGSGPSTFIQNTWSPGESDLCNLEVSKDSPQDTVYMGSAGSSNGVFLVRDSGSVNIVRGVLDMQGNMMSPYPAGVSLGRLTLTMDATLRCGGYDNFPLNSTAAGNPPAYFAAYNLESGSNVEYYMLSSQVVRAQSGATAGLQYSNVRLLGSGKKSMSGSASKSYMVVNDTLTLASGASYGRMGQNTVLRYAATGVLQYRHNDIVGLQRLQITSDSEFVDGPFGPQNLSIFNKRDVKLGSPTTVPGVVSFIQGKVVLGLYDLDLTSTSYPVINADTNRYFVTDTACTSGQPGWLHLYCVNSSSYTQFPIGTICSRSGSGWGTDTSYSPISMKRATGGAKGYKARVSSWILRQVDDREQYVKREWMALEDGTDSTDMYVELGWEAADEGAGLDRMNAFMSTYHGTGYNLWAVPSGSGIQGGDPFFMDGFLREPSDKARMKSNLRINVGSAQLLPAGLSAFNAVRRQSDIVLSWRTASEYENAGFEVHRSIDGRAWEKIGWVPGYGTTTMPTEYSFADRGIELLMPQAVSYRLVQVDMNSETHVSPAVTVKIAGSSAVPHITGVYPNPVVDHANITFTLPVDESINITIHNEYGREVARLAGGVTYAKGSHMVSVSMYGLPDGLYYLVMQHRQGRETCKVIVAR
jgi:hypothetical protein